MARLVLGVLFSLTIGCADRAPVGAGPLASPFAHDDVAQQRVGRVDDPMTPIPIPTPDVEIEPGEHFDLPVRYPTKSPYGGLYQIWGRSVPSSPLLDMGWVGGMWKDLNPAADVYNTDLIEKTVSDYRYSIDELGTSGRTAIIWVNIGLYTPTGWAMPQWVRDKCAGAGTPIADVKNGDGDVWGAALWQSCPRTELLKFIRGMFTRYKNDDRVQYAYVTTFNAGEFWMPADVYASAVAAGLDEATMKSYGKDLVDAWTDALGATKVVWTSAGWSAAGAAWVCDYALDTVGTNLREGNAESISANLSQPLIGQGWDADYYLHSEPIEDVGLAGLRFYGDEFELADKYAGVFGDYPYYRLAVLNMLRKGENWAIFPPELRVTDNDAAYPEYAALRDYFRRSAGYPKAEAPDAWTMLQMFHDDCYNGTHQFKNYEKFMIQREVEPDGKTAVTELTTWAPDQYGFCKVGTNGATQPAVTYFARTTQHDAGSDYIYFDVDAGFARDDEHAFQIVVYYRDLGHARWHVEYSDGVDAYKATDAVTNVDDGQWKSAIFTLSDLHLAGAQNGAMDFRVYDGGSEDLVVGGVRLVRL